MLVVRLDDVKGGKSVGVRVHGLVASLGLCCS